MPPDPTAELMGLPPEYGTPEVPLAWEKVRDRLESAAHYWLATVRPDGRPHVVPLDGVWLDDRWYFGGSHDTVKHRNLHEDPRAVVHLEDGTQAVIVEGRCEELFPDEQLAGRLSGASKSKYGYAPPPQAYAETGVWCLSPQRVLAWEQFPRDATRFEFDQTG
jgi:nitroimidazol reductase NimA-like FMN-containing flavoprotein (pyridoxamine 5'-phosphate oxidase superfamily)